MRALFLFNVLSLFIVVADASTYYGSRDPREGLRTPFLEGCESEEDPFLLNIARTSTNSDGKVLYHLEHPDNLDGSVSTQLWRYSALYEWAKGTSSAERVARNWSNFPGKMARNRLARLHDWVQGIQSSAVKEELFRAGEVYEDFAFPLTVIASSKTDEGVMMYQFKHDGVDKRWRYSTLRGWAERSKIERNWDNFPGYNSRESQREGHFHNWLDGLSGRAKEQLWNSNPYVFKQQSVMVMGIRHGVSTNNVWTETVNGSEVDAGKKHGVYHVDEPVHLTSQGRQKVRDRQGIARRYLMRASGKEYADLVLSSPMMRAIETADEMQIQKPLTAVHVVPRLKEYKKKYGEAGNLAFPRIADFQAQLAQRGTIRHRTQFNLDTQARANWHEGQTWKWGLKDAMSAVKDVIFARRAAGDFPEHDGATVALFTHSRFMAGAFSALKKGNPYDGVKRKIGNAGIMVGKATLQWDEAPNGAMRNRQMVLNKEDMKGPDILQTIRGGCFSRGFPALGHGVDAAWNVDNARRLDMDVVLDANRLLVNAAERADIRAGIRRAVPAVVYERASQEVSIESSVGDESVGEEFVMPQYRGAEGRSPVWEGSFPDLSGRRDDARPHVVGRPRATSDVGDYRRRSGGEEYQRSSPDEGGKVASEEGIFHMDLGPTLNVDAMLAQQMALTPDDLRRSFDDSVLPSAKARRQFPLPMRTGGAHFHRLPDSGWDKVGLTGGISSS